MDLSKKAIKVLMYLSKSEYVNAQVISDHLNQTFDTTEPLLVHLLKYELIARVEDNIHSYVPLYVKAEMFFQITPLGQSELEKRIITDKRYRNTNIRAWAALTIAAISLIVSIISLCKSFL